MAFTESILNKLQQEGKIKGWKEVYKRGVSIPNNAENIPKEGNAIPKQRKPSKGKAWITKNLWAWCREKGYELKKEHGFHPTRKWRFDWAIPEINAGIEFEGIISDKSRHTTIKGYSGDVEKYNAAGELGWTVFRYTAINYKNVVQDIDKFWKKNT